MFVVPRGVEHKPYAEQEVKLMLIEPRGVLNTATREASAPPQMMSGYEGEA
jgi:mannose-6-phosphate isomerase-like protein (cupin superfamily)